MVTNWDNSTSSSSSHGVFLLNSHGMDILMRPGVLEYRVIGGTLDLYFVAGPRAIDVHEQYSQIVSTLSAQEGMDRPPSLSSLLIADIL
jgi:alpha-glucosidase